jgi:hypothetical protein
MDGNIFFQSANSRSGARSGCRHWTPGRFGQRLHLLDAFIDRSSLVTSAASNRRFFAKLFAAPPLIDVQVAITTRPPACAAFGDAVTDARGAVMSDLAVELRGTLLRLR